MLSYIFCPDSLRFYVYVPPVCHRHAHSSHLTSQLDVANNTVSFLSTMSRLRHSLFRYYADDISHSLPNLPTCSPNKRQHIFHAYASFSLFPTLSSTPIRCRVFTRFLSTAIFAPIHCTVTSGTVGEPDPPCRLRNRG